MLPKDLTHTTSKAGGAQRAPLFARALSWLCGTIQIVILAGLFYLDTLSRSRGGVHRHVYYMKGVYTAQDGIASPTNVLIVTVTVLLLTAVALVAVYTTKKRRRTKLTPLSVVPYVLCVLAASAFSWAALSTFGKAHLLYPYLLAGLLGVWAFSLINLFLTLARKR